MRRRSRHASVGEEVIFLYIASELLIACSLACSGG